MEVVLSARSKAPSAADRRAELKDQGRPNGASPIDAEESASHPSALGISAKRKKTSASTLNDSGLEVRAQLIL